MYETATFLLPSALDTEGASFGDDKPLGDTNGSPSLGIYKNPILWVSNLQAKFQIRRYFHIDARIVPFRVRRDQFSDFPGDGSPLIVLGIVQL